MAFFNFYLSNDRMVEIVIFQKIWFDISCNIFRDTMHAKHYENMSIQIYWKFYHQKMKTFR